jgi:hypothetical protein
MQNILIFLAIQIIVTFVFFKFIFKGTFKIKDLILNMLCLNGIVAIMILSMIVLPNK